MIQGKQANLTSSRFGQNKTELNIEEEEPNKLKKSKIKKKKVRLAVPDTDFKYNPNYKVILRENNVNVYWSKATGRQGSLTEIDGVVRA